MATVRITNRISEYLNAIVQTASKWYHEHKTDEDVTKKWISEQVHIVEEFADQLTSQQQSELLYFYSIDEIVKSSIKRYGEPFYIMDYQVSMKNDHFKSIAHEGFTLGLIEQLLWTELQAHIYFIEHSNT
jgi:hypothetical protein